MSADNWARCPRCVARGEARVRAREATATSMYGKVSVEEFDALRAEIDVERESLYMLRETFREDYEFYGTDSGVVTVSYRGACNVCGLSLSFQEDHPIPGLESAE